MYYKIKYELIKDDNTAVCYEHYIYIDNEIATDHTDVLVSGTISAMMEISLSSLKLGCVFQSVYNYYKTTLNDTDIVSIDILEIDIDNPMTQQEYDIYLQNLTLSQSYGLPLDLENAREEEEEYAMFKREQSI